LSRWKVLRSSGKGDWNKDNIGSDRILLFMEAEQELSDVENDV
jgi:hypothetical protein